MGLTGREEEFEGLCQQHETWIIKYVSTGFDAPVYMVWLTESTGEQHDKFILSGENKIVAATTPMALLDALRDLEVAFPDDEKTREWLIKAYLSESSPSAVYDIKFIEVSVSSKEMSHAFVAEAINFINLCGDLGHQLDDDELLDLTWDNSLRDLWDFYYDNIFWPRWGHEDTFDDSKVPIFEPNYEELASDFNLLIKEFESRIEIR